MKPQRLSQMAYVLDLLGVGLFAVSGALAGIHRGLDLFGITVLAAVTGIGGGTLRDLVLGRHPALWVRDPTYLYIILAGTSLAIAGQNFLPNLQTGFQVADAMGLGLFALSGAQLVEADHESWIIVIVMGTMTGVAGGVMRDVLSGVVPLLLRRDVYATAAMGGILFYLILRRLGVQRTPAYLVGITAVVSIRLLALAFHWQLPAFQAISHLG